MNTKELIQKNDELRKKLNEQNAKYYGDLLLYLRSKSYVKKEELVEETLFEILQDILTAQENEQSAEEYFGKNPEKIANEILEELPNENWLKILKTSGAYYIFFLLTGGIYFGLFTEKTLNFGFLLVGSIAICLLFTWILYLLGKLVYARKKQVFYWVLLAVSCLPIITLFVIGGKFIHFWEVPVSEIVLFYLKIICWTLVLLVTVYTAEKESRLALTLVAVYCFTLATAFIEKIHILSLVSGISIVGSILAAVGIVLFVKLYVKPKKQ
ncbi:hypothetical protein SAMN02745116_01377 [Pilibacter termitis]|uniref:Uncharacterized protein n=1 Tax=Pilibacter termitis TaxID=263852 RepID=A0A1T4NCS9_9ENTE|nr:hypothetical protein [Pilibacter termitis]SJZ76856.1 hypothetical protein SAMN02745116_01377 [Pilibacter termitis]